MTQSSTDERLPVIVALVMLLLFATILTYWIVDDRAHPADWKEARHFNLAVKTCGEAERKAKADFGRGVIRMYFSNDAVGEHPDGFPFNFYRRLEEDFGIEIIYTGDVYSSFHKCYNLEMDDLLDEKLGERTIENLFNKLRDGEYLQH